MKRKIFVRIAFSTVAVATVLTVLTVFFLPAWIEKKIRTTLDKNTSDYRVKIEKIHVSVFKRGLELESISILNQGENKSGMQLNGQIASVKISGINPWKILFNKDFAMSELRISNCSIDAVMQIAEDSSKPIIATFNLQTDKIMMDDLRVNIKDASSATAYSVIDGAFVLYDVYVLKKDTISFLNLEQLDFKAKEIRSVSSDSLYTMAVHDIYYSSDSGVIEIDSLMIQPNYKDYDFSARHRFQSDCIEAEFSNIYANHFSVIDYLQEGSIRCSLLEVGKMNLAVFRDRRKEFHHIVKPMFQQLIYDYSGRIDIDTIRLKNGTVAYTEHALEANHPGRIHFTDIDATLSNVSNDTVYKNEKAYLELTGHALLMGKGSMSVLLKSRLYDRHHTFSLKGTLSDMDASELNPMLERNAFIYVASGRIDALNFHFTATDKKATGSMTFLYHGLDLAMKNKQTDDTTAFKEQIISIIANLKVMDSNPLPGDELRTGIIDYERDPEKFLFNYCIKSILSGIKSSIAKNPEKRK